MTDRERRARLAVRHALAGSSKVLSPEDAARAVVCLHATDPPSVHLSCWVRVDGMRMEDVERALYVTRSLVRQQSLRATLFVFTRELVPAVWGSAAARIAAVYRRRLAKDLERWGPADEGQGATWLVAAEQAVMDHLADGVPRTSTQVRAEVPQVDGVIVQAPDKKWGGRIAIAPKVLALLRMDGVVARAGNSGAWYTSRPMWTTTEAWWGPDVPASLESRAGYAELVSRWLWSYGPGTVEDITWWLGSTRAVVRTALDDLGAQSVTLDNGATGWLHIDDLEPVADPEPWVALLPLLDPTIMGWKERAFILGRHASMLFDSVGNAGTTVWVGGHVVGAWVQDADGIVELRLLEEVTPQMHDALRAEAHRLTEWLNGQRVFTVYPSPAMQPVTDR